MKQLERSASHASTLPPIRPVRISLVEIFSMAIEALWSNRLRTSLTMLGVIIGIASVIMVTSVGQGVQKATEQQIQSLGTMVLAGAARSGGISQGAGSAATLTWEDAQAVARQAPAATGVAPFLQTGGQVVYGDRNVSTFILGVDLSYPSVKEIQPQEGQFFSQEDLDLGNAVVVLGSKVKNDLFGAGELPIGQNIRIQSGSYTVVGVMESKGSVGVQDCAPHQRFPPHYRKSRQYRYIDQRHVGEGAG